MNLNPEPFVKIVVISLIFTLGVVGGFLLGNYDKSLSQARATPEPVVCTLQHYPEVETKTYMGRPIPSVTGELWTITVDLNDLSDSTGLIIHNASTDRIEFEVTEMRLLTIRRRATIYDTTVTILGK